MKTITLRTLLRNSAQIKRWTRAGRSVRVTDDGQPLWILQPADATPDEEERRRATQAILDEVLRESRSRVSTACLLEESRR